jgi:hypothetical protein
MFSIKGFTTKKDKQGAMKKIIDLVGLVKWPFFAKEIKTGKNPLDKNEIKTKAGTIKIK